MSRVSLLLEGHIPPEVDLEKLKANDREEFRKIAKEMANIWSFHFARMPQEDWSQAKEMLDKSQLGGELN